MRRSQTDLIDPDCVRMISVRRSVLAEPARLRRLRLRIADGRFVVRCACHQFADFHIHRDIGMVIGRRPSEFRYINLFVLAVRYTTIFHDNLIIKSMVLRYMCFNHEKLCYTGFFVY